MIVYRTEKIIDSFDLDKLVEETYGKVFTFQQQDGCKPRGTERITVPVIEPFDYKNDTIKEQINGPEMGVSFKVWLNKDPNYTVESKERFKDIWWGRNFYPHIDMIINDLYKKGLIEKGEYTIEIDW